MNKRAGVRLFKLWFVPEPVHPMQIIKTVAEMRLAAAKFNLDGKTIALVPTQGALHAGQDALIRAAVERADAVIVTIFVNPLQFPANEIPANYPRSLGEDLQLCEAAGAHVVFVPDEAEIYPKGFSTFVQEESASKLLCGPSRPNHFRGITTLMAILFNLLRPDYVFYGQKTIQRAVVVRRMSEQLQFGVEVIVVPTVREPDGLAAGVRNREFTPTMRNEALAIYTALKRGGEMVAAGVRSPDRIIAEATHILGQQRRVRVIYVALVDAMTLEPAREIIPGQVMLTIAAWIDEVRLIDNAML